MALSKDERAQLEALQSKEKEPPDNRQEHVSITVDLSDPAAVKRAMRLGYLTAADLDDDDTAGNDDDDDDENDDDDEEAAAKKKKRDPAPKRRLSMADRTLGSDE